MSVFSDAGMPGCCWFPRLEAVVCVLPADAAKPSLRTCTPVRAVNELAVAARAAPQALQHTNVELTWDAGDTSRKAMLNRKVTEDEIREDDFKVSPCAGVGRVGG